MWVLLDTNRTLYVESPTAPLDLSLMFKLKVTQILKVYFSEKSQLGHMLLLNTDRNPYMGSPINSNCTIRFDLE